MGQLVVSQLNPGQKFRTGGLLAGWPEEPGFYWDYKLIYATQHRAYVEPLMKRKTRINEDVEFESGSGRVNISSSVPCIPLDDDGEEDLFGPRTAEQLEAAPRTKTVRALASAKPLGSAPLNPATKRGKLVDMFLKGYTVSRVCEELGIKRGCAMSHLSDARKFNGVAYELNGEKVKISYKTAAPVEEELW